MLIERRKLLLGIGGTLLAAPAVIRTPGLLMPIRPIDPELLKAAAGAREVTEVIRVMYRIILSDDDEKITVLREAATQMQHFMRSAI